MQPSQEPIFLIFQLKTKMYPMTDINFTGYPIVLRLTPIWMAMVANTADGGSMQYVLQSLCIASMYSLNII